MQITENKPNIKNKALGMLFLSGLFLIVLDGAAFLLFEWDLSGLLFSIGMVVILVIALISVLLGEKAPPSEIITLIVGAGFFLWLILHNL